VPEEVHDTEVAVEALVTVTLAVPELAALFESPGYDAIIVALPAVAPVTVKKHVPDEIKHVGVEGRVTLPLPPLWTEKVIASPSTLPLVPVTVAVHVEPAPIAIGDAHDTVVVVVASGTM